MLYPFSEQNFSDSQADNYEIKFEALPLQVFVIELHFEGNRQLVTAIDLRPTCETWHQQVNAPLCPKGDEVVLIE